ncbi:putative DNA methylase [Methanocella paludicola SANAE]|uniref:Type II methyltransferase n=1 Tax=Methanocella paludicola (strain DSM 17711 / JCM 13418 / NBRC 101707 / SANAE) TaxID=304371 RepID=D1YZ26_METPS|nr:site-specific DNA-methyltransferase [Methanocella paludicola]BAI61698.1 putative DNA methylase [Methanocella paludicola SANAE]
MRKKANGTETSAFGSAGRYSHDSSKFYGGRLYEGLQAPDIVEHGENPVPAKRLNKIFCKSSERMDELPDNSVHLMVTSPPYNVGKEYDDDLTLDEYRALLFCVWEEVYRVLVPGGRVCLNVANLGRKPYLPLHAFMAEDLLKAGFLMRGEVIWNKASAAGTSTAWGSWQSAKNPTLRDVHEYILVFSKQSYSRTPGDKRSTITKEEFLEYTKSVWSFGSESAKKIGHPAPYPVELPSRCIKLYTFEGDVVLDPFIGSGTTAVAAKMLDRHYVGYEVDEEYVELARRRLKNHFL